MPDFKTSQSIMAFDFGTQKMGIAIGQSTIESANPLPLFVMKDGIPDWNQLLKLVKEWQPNLFLVGLPLNMDDSESELSLRARKFARRLKHRLNMPVWMVDERLSSREAREQIKSYQQQGRAKRVATDNVVACLLIESWFNEQIGILP